LQVEFDFDLLEPAIKYKYTSTYTQPVKWS